MENIANLYHMIRTLLQKVYRDTDRFANEPGVEFEC